MVEADLLRIGQLAKLANVTPRTVRFYIQEGLLPKPVHIHKTMALYSRDCIEKITAIKTAQNKHFLPLMVIRNILEQNEYDYTRIVPTFSQIEKEKKPVSSAGSKEADSGLSLNSVNTELSISPDLVKQMANHKTWIRTSDFKFLENISTLQQNGVSLEEQMLFFNSMQDIIEKGVELEIETLIKLLIKNPNKNFTQSLEIEKQVVQKFIGKIRERRLQQYFKAYADVMDNSYRASVDEGFALPTEEIMEDLQTLESS
jgi:DNA-binding transcriptional MerR regulator